MALDGQKLNFVGGVRQPMIDVVVGWLVQEVVEEVVDVGCGGGGGDGKKPGRFVLFRCGDVMLFWLVGGVYV